ncbi:polyprenyl synthetase family protein [Streptomyces sp. NPDC006733]|uniref:polyprenyl synthetase family protein n=1 Tax=Streptomyces sp. NPDC006733 TaxID=3155460 RepID=UPI0033F011F3
MTQHVSPVLFAPSATEILERGQWLVRPALRDATSRLHPDVARMAEFTLGWCDADGTPRHDNAAKGVRPALAVLCAEAVGGPAEAAVAGAAAVELVHTFSLVHDDIMDGDERRRHRDTVWKSFGVGPAVLAGDALFALAVGALAETAPQVRPAAVRALSHALVDLVNGQAEDISFERRPWSGLGAVTVDEYSAMAGCKTGALLGCAAGLGALLGGAPADVVNALTRMGRHLGLAFQAVDDLLGIWGDPAVTGKPVFSDLRRGKKTLPVIAALSAGPAVRAELLDLLDPRRSGTGSSESGFRRAAALIDEAGGRSFTTDLAERQLDLALRIIDEAAVDREAVAGLTVLCDLVANRTR